MRDVTSIPSVMTQDNVPLKDPQQILNGFASVFQSSFTTSTNFSVEATDSNSNVPHLAIPLINEVDVLNALKLVKPKLTTGPDGIPAFLLKDCALLFAFPLSVIFSLSLQTATFPNIWKQAKICPVYKKDDKAAVENYRPITILCNFSKLFESVLYNILFSHVKSQICFNQHGFLAGRSTVTNLACITQFIAEALDEGGQVDVIYTDFSKAFDTLDHGILLQKLFNFGLTFTHIYLTGNLLSNTTDLSLMK